MATAGARLRSRRCGFGVSRFSYVNNYLPELYRENKFSPAADQPGPSTRHDFFERFVDIFEAQ